MKVFKITICLLAILIAGFLDGWTMELKLPMYYTVPLILLSFILIIGAIIYGLKTLDND